MSKPMPDRSDQPPPADVRGQPRIDATTLFRGTRMVLIEHRGETYVLRHTRNGKLILTK